MPKSSKKSPPEEGKEAAPRARRIFSPQLMATALLLLAVGVGARFGWEHLRDSLARSGRYQLTAETIFVVPAQQPPWIRSDVKGEVLRDANLSGSASLLDDPQELHQRLVGAFEVHPWIEEVEKIEFVGPQRIEIHLRYREPVAVVQGSRDASFAEYLLVDTFATRLPDGDLSDVEKSYMPRLVGVEGRPLVGEPWTDARVLGGVRLAARLRPVWERYRLMEIVPAPVPDIIRSQRYFTYSLRTTGGTTIRWGGAPDMEPPGESPFKEKLERLARYIEEYGPLDSVTGPEEIDVRHQTTVKMRVAQEGEQADAIERR